MKYHISELVDAEKLQNLMESFYEMTSFPCTLVDPQGNILKTKDNNLLGAGWKKICLEFHRKHPESLVKCVESDTILSKQVLENKRYALYKCRNGMVDGAFPIFVSGEHVANLFTGQFFLEQPDVDYFRRQAADYGYDVEEYLNALSEVPILDKKIVEKGLVFLGQLAELIALMGFKEKELLDLKNELQERVEERTLELRRALTDQKLLQHELQRQAQSDCLTGLANRSHFINQSEKEIVRTLRYGRPMSVLMLDIDHFKEINDTHGHQAGDTALRMFAAHCQEALREIDIIGRVGGEEFAVILPETDGDDAYEVAERLCQSIASQNITTEKGASVRLTASIGLTTLSVGGDANFDSLLRQADEALYMAKRSGRNRVCVFSS